MVSFVPQPAVQVLQKDVTVRTGQSPDDFLRSAA